MCCINNSISCLEKKTTVSNTLSNMLCPHPCLSTFNCVFVPPSNVSQHSTVSLSPLQYSNVCLYLISLVYTAWTYVVLHITQEIYTPLCKSCSIYCACFTKSNNLFSENSEIGIWKTFYSIWFMKLEWRFVRNIWLRTVWARFKSFKVEIFLMLWSLYGIHNLLF